MSGRTFPLTTVSSFNAKCLADAPLRYVKRVISVGNPLFSMGKVPTMFAYFSLLIYSTNTFLNTYSVLVMSIIHERNLQFQPKHHTVSKATGTKWEPLRVAFTQTFQSVVLPSVREGTVNEVFGSQWVCHISWLTLINIDLV